MLHCSRRVRIPELVSLFYEVASPRCIGNVKGKCPCEAKAFYVWNRCGLAGTLSIYQAGNNDAFVDDDSTAVTYDA